jgi:hypothetical protein
VGLENFGEGATVSPFACDQHMKEDDAQSAGRVRILSESSARARVRILEYFSSCSFTRVVPLRRTLLTSGLQDWTQPRLASWTLVRLQGEAAVTRRGDGRRSCCPSCREQFGRRDKYCSFLFPSRVRREKNRRWMRLS